MPGASRKVKTFLFVAFFPGLSWNGKMLVNIHNASYGSIVTCKSEDVILLCFAVLVQLILVGVTVNLAIHEQKLLTRFYFFFFS